MRKVLHSATSYYYYQCWTANLAGKLKEKEGEQKKKITWVMSEGVKTQGHSGNTGI